MSRILSVRKQRGVVYVECEDETVLRVPASLFRERPLREGDPWDPEAYAAWLAGREYPHALARAVDYLAARPRTEREMETCLRRCGYTEPAIARVMERLLREGYLNDAQFADLWAQARQERALGKRRIAQELLRKGVSRERIDAALAQVDDAEQLRQAAALCERLIARTRARDERDARRKVLAALVRRGYSWDVARQAYSRAAGTDDGGFDEWDG